MTQKINYQNLKIEIAKLKTDGKTIALLHGCFDKLHDGHRSLLKKAKQIADIVVLGVENDEYIKRVKGPNRPYLSLKQRINQIVQESLADYIFPIKRGVFYSDMYKDFQPNFLVTAQDEVFYKKLKDAKNHHIQIIAIEKSYHSSHNSRSTKKL